MLYLDLCKVIWNVDIVNINACLVCCFYIIKCFTSYVCLMDCSLCSSATFVNSGIWVEFTLTLNPTLTLKPQKGSFLQSCLTQTVIQPCKVFLLFVATWWRVHSYEINSPHFDYGALNWGAETPHWQFLQYDCSIPFKENPIKTHVASIVRTHTEWAIH